MFGFSLKRPQNNKKMPAEDAEKVLRTCKEFWALDRLFDIISEHDLPLPQRDDRTSAAATVASFILNEGIRKNHWALKTLDQKQEFAALIMSFVVADYCSRIVGSNFVRVHLLVTMNIFPKRRGAALGSLIREGSVEYNKLATDPEQYKIVYSIGQNTADWINNKNNDFLDRIAGLLGLMAQAVE